MSEAVSGPTPRINHFQSGGLDCSPKRRLRQNEFWLYSKSPYHSEYGSEGCCGRCYSLVLSLLSFSRMNASISAALASMRSHCSL